MALTKRPAAQFEAAPATVAEPVVAAPAAVAAPVAAPVQAPAPAPAPALIPNPAGLAVVIKPSTAAVAIAEGMRATEAFKDALRVEWNDCPRMKTGQGRITALIGGVKTEFGKWVDFELQSYQDNWLISPGGDTDEAKSLAKYSDDGKTVKETGQSIPEYIKELNVMGYKEARLAQRMVALVSLLDCEGNASVPEGQLFQIDMAPTTRSAFEQFRKQSAFDISKGRLTADNWASNVRATASIQTQTGKTNEYTVLGFTRTPA